MTQAADELLTEMPINPGNLAEYSAHEVLEGVASGRLGFDHRVLHALVDRPQDTLPDIIRFAMSDRESDAIMLEDELVALFRYLRTPEAIPYFVEFIRRDPSDIPDDLVDALYPLRRAALDPLLELYKELEEEESGELAFLLAAFRVQDERILPLLLDRLEYDAGDGALSLGMYGDPAARPALEKLLAEVPSSDSHLRQDIADAIEQLGRPFEDEPVQEYDIWKDFPEKALPEFDVLSEGQRVDLLADSDPECRIGAAESLRNTELSSRARQALLDRARSDEDAAVRGACWRALITEAEDKPIREAMLARLQDEAVPLVERSGALLGLANEADKEPVRSFAEQFYENPETRAAALGAMWRSLDRTFGPILLRHVKDEDTNVKEEAIMGSGYLGVHEAADALQELFSDEDHRADALFAYALCVRHETSRGRVRSLLRKIDEAAGGLNVFEDELVKTALDERLLLHGHEPVFFPDRHEHREQRPAAEPQPTGEKVGRNDACPCGSGKKYKKCCGS